MTQTIKAAAFDAYGTLFDVYSVGALAETMFPGHGAQLAEIWRVAQIDYTRLRTLSDRYRDFEAITGDALNFAADTLGLDLGGGRSGQLMEQYSRLEAFAENRDVLEGLKAGGLTLVVLSNGTPAMLDSAIEAAGFGGLFAHALSADTVRKFKTAPEVYRLGPEALGCPASEIVFVSSNGWDACGAAWFGYRSFWVNRAGRPLERLGVRPEGEGRSLTDLPEFIAGL